MSCGLAPAQRVSIEITRGSRSGIICTGARKKASTPKMETINIATVTIMGLCSVKRNMSQ